MAGLSVGIPVPTPIDLQLESYYQLAQQPNYIYFPFIMNTILVMIVLNKMTGNLLLPETIPYGGFQLTYNGINHIEESGSDVVVNNLVINEILNYIEIKREEGVNNPIRVAVSLFLHNPINAEVNHANMLLFEYNKVTNTLKVFHYEPYGDAWKELFSTIAVKEKELIDDVINRIKTTNQTNKTIKLIIPVFNISPVNHQLPTRIDQRIISKIQSYSEGGYCQMIALLQAILFLIYGTTFTPDGYTPLGSVINNISQSVTQLGNSSPSISKSGPGIFQLNVIRGFTIDIGNKINEIFEPIGIDISINTLSRIQKLYKNQPGAPPIYLIYIDALVKYFVNQTQTGVIIPSDIMSVIVKSKTVMNASELTKLEDMVMTLLKRNVEDFELSEREKQRILRLYPARAAADDARARAAAQTDPFVTLDTVRHAKKTAAVVPGKVKSTKRVIKGGKPKTKKTKKKQRKTKKTKRKTT